MSEHEQNTAEQEARDARLMDLLYGDDQGEAGALDSEDEVALEDFRGLRVLFSQLEDESPPLALTHRLQAAAAAEVGGPSASASATGSWLQRLFRPFVAYPGFAAAASLVVVAGVAGAIYMGGEHRLAEPSLGAAEPAAASAPRAERVAGDSADKAPAPPALAPKPEPAPTKASSAPSRRKSTSKSKKLLKPLRSTRSSGGKLNDALSEPKKPDEKEKEEAAPEPTTTTAGGGTRGDSVKRKARGPAKKSAPKPDSNASEAVRLHKQATAAAKKGLCDKALKLADRVRSLDSRYYDTTLLSDPAIRRCRRAGGASKK